MLKKSGNPGREGKKMMRLKIADWFVMKEEVVAALLFDNPPAIWSVTS